jgi:hypothetical protein
MTLDGVERIEELRSYSTFDRDASSRRDMALITCLLKVAYTEEPNALGKVEVGL